MMWRWLQSHSQDQTYVRLKCAHYYTSWVCGCLREKVKYGFIGQNLRPNIQTKCLLIHISWFTVRILHTSCMVRSEMSTTRLSSTLTISPVSPSYFPPITLAWSPVLKCFFNSSAGNSNGSFRSSCFGIIVILLPSIPMILPWRWINSPSQTSTTSPAIKLWVISPALLSGITGHKVKEGLLFY